VAEERINVLLVEDDEDDYILTRELLREIRGVTVGLKWVSHYDEGMQLLAGGGFDVCLVDYRLGEHSGVEFIAEAGRRALDVPVILLTSQGDHAVDMAAMRAGAADFLNKAQINADLLERSIRYSIQQKRAEKQRLAMIGAQAAKRELEAENRAKDQFLATLSHELRTPLNAILGWAQLLRSGELDEAARRQAVETIERNAKAQAQLIEDLLDVSRIVSGKIRLEVKRVRVEQVIDAALDVVRPAAEQKGIELVKDAEGALGAVLGDPTRLQQVVWNLMSNAIKFTPEGGRVEVGARREGDGGGVRIWVKDDGKGIDAEFLPHVWDRFRQADSTTTRRHSGLGLGLAIVKHLVELHQGKASAESAGEGRGSTFSIWLPLLSETEEAGDAGDRPAQCGRPLDGLRIVVVDDELDARMWVSQALAMRGAEVRAVGSAEEAMDAVKQMKPDVLVSDVAMPGEDGYRLIRRVREWENGGRRILAVATTALASETDKRQAMEAGFDRHLAKPVSAEALVGAVMQDDG
jgi:signal transduction histidine kinase